MPHEAAGGAQWPLPAQAIDAARLPVRAGLASNGDGTWSYTTVPAEIEGVIGANGDGTGSLDTTTTVQSGVRLARAADLTIVTYGGV